MNKADIYMKEAIDKILADGYLDVNPRPKYADGTPAHTISVNHVFRTYDLSKDEFPICTLRPQAWKTSIREIFTIYKNPTNVISEMEEMGVNWWGEWDIGDGTIGQRYGATVKRYDFKNDPYGRRKVVSLWQENDLRETAGLAPCAFLTIWNVRNKYVDGIRKEFLDMCLIQRSGDMLTASGAGCANEIQYAALLMMIARHCGYEAGVFSHFVANEQIYNRHEEAAVEMNKRYFKVEMDEYYDGCHANPKMTLNPEKTNFYDMTIEDFTLENYEPIRPNLKLELGI